MKFSFQSPVLVDLDFYRPSIARYLGIQDFPSVLDYYEGARSVEEVTVEPDLSVPGHPDIFVIGDLAHCAHGGEPLPGVAPVAMQQGRYVARVLRQRQSGKSLKPFRYRNRGNLATIGRAAAVAHLGRLQFGGLWAWIAWVLIHIRYLIEFENKLLVLFQWAWNYVTWNRSARLITGKPAWPLGQSEASEREETKR